MSLTFFFEYHSHDRVKQAVRVATQYAPSLSSAVGAAEKT